MSYEIRNGLEDVAKAIDGGSISASNLVAAIEKLAEANVEAARIQAAAVVKAAQLRGRG